MRRAIPGGERLEIASARRDPRRCRCGSSTARSRSPTRSSSRPSSIGLVGLSSSFGALVLARRREFGMLRHLGMTRRQIGAMLATEGLVVSGVGLAVGLALGFVDQPDPDPRGQPAVVPLGHGTVAAVARAGRLRGRVLLVLSSLTALASGRRAMSGDVVRAVKDDW